MEKIVKPWVSAAVGIIGGLIFGYSQGITSSARDSIIEHFNLKNDPLQDLFASLITATILIGAMFGSLGGGILVDRLGRRMTSYIGSGICLYGTITAALSPDIYTFLILRFILGVGVGLMGVLCPLYVSETAPPEKKGTFGTLFQLSLTFGIFVSGIIGYGLQQINNKSLDWRLMIGLGTIFPIMLIVLTWLFMEEPPLVKPEQNELLVYESNIPATPENSGWIGLFTSPINRIPLITGIVLSVTLQLTGINAIMFYGPDIVASAGLSDYKFQLNVAIFGWNFITTFIALFLVDRLGRRPLMLVGTLIMTIAMLAEGFVFVFMESPDLLTAKGAAVGTGLFLFIGGFEASVGCLFWILINEVFPENVKSQGGTFCNILQWGFNLAVSMLVPLVPSKPVDYSYVPFFIFGGSGLLCLVYLYFFLRPPKKDYIN